MRGWGWLFVLLAGCCLGAGEASGQGALGKATVSAKRDLDAILQDFNALNEEVAKEKLPLHASIELLEAAVWEEAATLKDVQREQVARSRDQVQLDNEVKARRVEADFMASVLRDYARGFLNRVHPSEFQRHQEAVETSNDRVEAGNLTRAEEFVERLEIVDRALTRLEEVIGGAVYEGMALTESEGVVKGHYALVGPAAYFAAGDGGVAGVTTAVTEEGVKPTVIDVGHAAGVLQLAEAGEGLVPLDPSGGRALVMDRAKDSLSEHLAKGGIVGYFIIGLGAFSFLVALFKWIELQRFPLPARRQIHSLLDHLQGGRIEQAQKEARALPGPAGEMMQVGVENFHRKRRVLEELLYEKLLAIKPRLERYLPFLAVTAAAAPLMGLLGTVMGMIKTFKLITEFGTGDAKSLSSGISEALVTTELGLVVAIPILIIHGVLVRMARSRVGRMESGAMAFLNGVGVKDLPDLPEPEPDGKEKPGDEDVELQDAA